jgi:hypothetical protein
VSAMDGLFIDADARRIIPYHYQYSDMGPRLGGNIAIGYVFANGDVCYVSDDGLLKPARRAFRIKARGDGQPMMSNAIVTGRDNPDLDSDLGTLAATFTVFELLAQIEFISVDEALRWFRIRASEPAVTRKVPGQPLEVIARWQSILDNLEDRPGGYSPDQIQL